MTTAGDAKAVPFRYNRQLQILCALFVLVFADSAYKPIMPVDWWVENGLVFICLGGLIVTYRRFVFSELSYLLIFIFLCLHEWGAHTRYAFVPFGEWTKAVFGTMRNDYDRIVHGAFGLCVAYPQHELLLRGGGLKWKWSLWLTPVLILGYGAAYEIVEAVAATLLSPDAGEAFLGLQGDPWDTHKDMFMAFAGAIVAMLITALLSRRARHV
jgi:putative membrane protein